MNLLDIVDRGLEFIKTEVAQAYYSLREFKDNYMRFGKIVKSRTKRFLLDRKYIADVHTTVGFFPPRTRVRHYIWTKKGWDRYKLLSKLKPILAK